MNGVMKGMILVLMIMYIVSPLDACPGPLDDFIVLLIGIAARKGLEIVEGQEDYRNEDWNFEKGDKVLTITTEFIAVQRKNGEVDIIPMVKDEMGLRVDIEGIVTIGYGENIVEVSTGDVVVTTF